MTVVVGVDSAAHSTDVLAKAMVEAERRSEELHVVHVFNPPVVYMEVPIDMAQVAEGERRAVWEQLQPVFADSVVEVEQVDLDGYPPDALVGYADEVAASLLVIGTRGRGELASLILGSTSHRAIHLAGCDVLVVKPTKS